MNTTAEQILNTATTMIKTRGYNAFSYNDIAKEIGIKTASIHYHYPGKHSLGVSVMTRYRKLNQDELQRIESSTNNPVIRLTAYAELFSDTLGSEFHMCPCGMLSADSSTLPPEVKAEVLEFFKDNEQWLSRVLKEGLKQKLFQFEATPGDCAKMIFAAFEGAMLSAKAFEDKTRLSKALKQIIKLIQP